MPQFVTGSFNTMDPRLLSPIQAGIRSFGDIQKGLLGQQQARQAGIKTKFLPYQIQALLRQEQEKAKQAQRTTQFQPAKIKSDIFKVYEPYLMQEMLNQVKGGVFDKFHPQNLQNFTQAMGMQPGQLARGADMGISSPQVGQANIQPAQATEFVPKGAGWVKKVARDHKTYWINRSLKRVKDSTGKDML